MADSEIRRIVREAIAARSGQTVQEVQEQEEGLPADPEARKAAIARMVDRYQARREPAPSIFSSLKKES
jgi:hypothetical protein